jgi:brefeldin A-inhibited guanine nucleotide-exchange protein
LNQFKDVAWPPSSRTNRTVHGEEDDDEFDLPPSHSIDLNDSSDDALGYNNGREEKDVGAYVKESRKNMETLGGDDATAADTASDEVNVGGEGNGEQEIETGAAEAEVVANGNDKETIVESTNHDDHDEFTNLEENPTEEVVLDSNVNIGIGTVTTSEEEAEEEKNMFAHVQSATDVLQADDDGPLRSQEEEEDIDLRSVVSDVDKTEKEIMMRPEVITALNCYYLTISHPVATAKMIEIALECIGLLISNRYVIGSTTNKLSKSADDSHEELDIEEEGNNVPHVMRLINSICACADNPSDAVQSAMVKDLLSLMTSPSCSVHEAGMLKAVRTVFHIYLISKNDDVKKMSREVLLDMLRSVFQRMEAYDAVAQVDQQEGKMNESFELPKSPKNNPEEDDGKNNLFVSRFHTDSYLLFRALCKLSAKPLPEDAEDNTVTSAPGKNLRVFTGSKSGNSDPMATATKILSLELILSVFEHCGPAFRNGEKFIYAVKNFLCVSLLKNCVSSNTTVAHLSLKVFLLLVSFRACNCTSMTFNFRFCAKLYWKFGIRCINSKNT